MRNKKLRTLHKQRGFANENGFSRQAVRQKQVLNGCR